MMGKLLHARNRLLWAIISSVLYVKKKKMDNLSKVRTAVKEELDLREEHSDFDIYLLYRLHRGHLFTGI